MTETERRFVVVVEDARGVNFAAKGNGSLHIRLSFNDGDTKVFSLMLGDKVIAESHSDHALSTWAFKQNGVFDVKHDYNLADGDDGR